MALFGFGEKRSRTQKSFNITGSGSSDAALMINGTPGAFSGERVTETDAMGVPAISAAVHAIASTCASLPLNLYRRTGEGRVKAGPGDPLQRIIHDVVSPRSMMTAPQWVYWAVTRLHLSNRAITYIEMNAKNRVIGFMPLDEKRVQVEIDDDNVRTYVHTDDFGRTKRIPAWKILDFAKGPITHDGQTTNPIQLNRNIIGEMIAAQRSASHMFQSGGIPAHVITQPQGSPEAMARGVESIWAGLRSIRAKKLPALPMPNGFEIKAIGSDAKNQQHVELRGYHLGEVARIFNIPPSFIQDHSKSTYSNVEQLNIHFSQHTIRPILVMMEAEMNAKLFADRNRSSYVEFEMAGLERGDLKTQYDSFRIGIHGGFLTPNEVRAKLNMEAKEGGDELYIQGATVPMAQIADILDAEPDAEVGAEEPNKENEEPDAALEEDDNG
jgi:HK97 family phage portal protein